MDIEQKLRAAFFDILETTVSNSPLGAEIV